MNLNYIIPALIVGTMGWLLYLTGLPVIGGLAGAGTGAALGYLLAGSFSAEWANTVLPAVGGVAGAVLGFWLIRVFQIYLFFAAGASLAGALAYNLIRLPSMTELMNPDDLGTFLFVAVCALVGGLLCVRLRRFIVAVITSVIGVFLLVPGLPPSWQGPGLVIGLVVFLAIQIGMVRRYVDKESFDRRTRSKPDFNAKPDVRKAD